MSHGYFHDERLQIDILPDVVARVPLDSNVLFLSFGVVFARRSRKEVQFATLG